jgi:hypothetical protein
MQKNPFDIVKNIMKKETRLELEDPDYPSYMVNKIFSNDEQLALFANCMNRSEITPRMNYHFYYYGIPKIGRYIAYNKKTLADKEVRYLMQYYECNSNLAKTYMKLLSKEEIKEIVGYYEKRGVVK